MAGLLVERMSQLVVNDNIIPLLIMNDYMFPDQTVRTKRRQRCSFPNNGMLSIQNIVQGLYHGNNLHGNYNKGLVQ